MSRTGRRALAASSVTVHPTPGAPGRLVALTAALIVLAGSTQPVSAQFEQAPGGAPPLKLRMGTIDVGEPRPLTAGVVGQAARGKHFVIQLDGPMTAQRREALLDAGVELLDYLPVNAFLARLDRVDPQKLARVSFVRWHGEYRAEWKTDPDLGLQPLESPERVALAAQGRLTVVVTLHAGLAESDVAGAVAAISTLPGATVHQRTMLGRTPLIVATVHAQDVIAIEGLGAVQFIEESPEISERSSTVRWVVQSNIPGVNSLWSNGLTGAGLVAGVIDSRIDTNHCSFSDVNAIGPGHRKILAYNAQPSVAASHGTHVAGILAGDAGDTSDTRGIAYEARLVYNLTPTFTATDVYERLALHHAQGACIHSNSWGANTTNSYSSLVRGVDQFCYDHEDDLVAFATRNGALGTVPVSSPENAKNCIAVGASGDTPLQMNHCSGSFGPTIDGRRKPEIFAPGCNILAAAVGTGCGVNQQTGSSMATPALSGVAVLMRQYFLQGYYPTGLPSADGFSPSGALLKATLINSAVDMTGVPGFPSDSEGWGRVLADNALHFPGDPARLFVVDRRNGSGLSTGQFAERIVNVTDSAQPLKITLAWTEPPANVASGYAPINNLNLVAISPSSTVYLGNWFVGGQSASGGSPDTVNNVEQVLLALPESGAWTIRVEAAAVNVGTQGFALVVTGGIDQPADHLQFTVDPLPALIAPGSSPTVTAHVQLGDESLVNGPTLHYRLDGGVFQSAAMSSIGPGVYQAALPAVACGDTPEFYVDLEGDLSGLRTLPHDGPASLYTTAIGTTSSTLLYAEDFESGLPGNWSASGLWHVTGACGITPVCDGGQWAYFGVDGPCNYNLGSTTAVGNLNSPLLALPMVDVGERLVLSFCASLDRENFANFDVASLQINGVEQAQFTAPTASWLTREFELTPWAGQDVVVTWRFNSIDGFANAQRGWQVDNVRIELRAEACITPPPPTCAADFNGDGAVNSADLSILLSNFGSSGATLSSGDANGDGLVNAADLSVLLSNFGKICD